MLQTLYYLSGYNNYYNRVVKRPPRNLVEDYLPWVVITTPPTSFNPSDGINTVIDVNYISVDDIVELDYLVISEDNINVSSRWFVLERSRNLSGQWKLKLRRDLIIDYYYEVINSPVFIEKASLPISNKLIFNKENGINYNQIKKSEVELKDETGTGWLVGYLADDHEEKEINVSSAQQIYPEPPISLETIQGYSDPWHLPDGQVNNITFIGPRYITGNNQTWWITIYDTGVVGTKLITEYDQYEKFFGGVYGDNATTIHDAANALAAQVAARRDRVRDGIATLYQVETPGTYISSADYATLNSMSGATYTDTGGTTFKISVTDTTRLATGERTVTSSSGEMYQLMDEIFDAAEVGADLNGPIPSFYAQAYPTRLSINVEIIASQADCTIKTSVSTLDDAPYKMFAIPAGNLNIAIGAESYANNINVARRVASKIATLYGGLGTTSFIYDIQLLPYCPMRAVVSDPGWIDLSTLTVDIEYTKVKIDTNTPASIILWPTTSNFNFAIEHNIDVPLDAINFKIDNETKFVRLCSPNYSGTFEFKPTMNYGVSRFEVNCTYKPYQPYIHISPVFNNEGLYGGDFNDQRGLVCTGDFSIPVKNDAWVNYQIQNKSYYDSFNRQIENMSTTYDINRKQTETAGKLNALTAGLGVGMGAGMTLGMINPAAGVAGGLAAGAAGAAVSMYGLREDLKYMDQLQAEALSFAKDNFGYQLQNITALPYTLGRVGAFNINNKIFPFLEFYDASDEEREALRLKLIYNGFTVMTTGKIVDYLINSDLPSGETFVQGQLIRYQLYDDNSLPIDYHTAAEIASELHKGVYI